MKTIKDYEKQLKDAAYKSHDLQQEADSISIDTALVLIEEAAKNSFERGFCAGLISKPNVTVDDIADDLKTKWSGIKDWFHAEFTNP